MRRGRNQQEWRADDGTLIALSLGADWVSEHEWGIRGIKRRLGIPDVPIEEQIRTGILGRVKGLLMGQDPIPVGIPARTIQNGDPIIHNLEDGPAEVKEGRKRHQMWGIALVDGWRGTNWDWTGMRDLWWDPRAPFLSWWNEGGFAILHSDRGVVEELVGAFEKGDVAIWVGSSGPFENGGLIIAIGSRLPEDFLSDAREADLDRLRLYKASQSSGIHRKLKQAGLEYWALSPAWQDDEKTEIKFWLNPRDQKNCNAGWYTLQELELWCQGKGPVVQGSDQSK